MPDLLLELRSEEIPARMQRKAAGDLRKLVTDALVDAGLTYEGAKEYWTPRRLTLDLRGVSARSADRVEEVKGPSTKAPEQAVQGFLRKTGLASIAEARIESDPKKGDFYVAALRTPGRPAEDIIADILPGIIRAFPWPKSMRWGQSSAPKGSVRHGVEGKGPESLRWVRPLQSIVCTFGPETEETRVIDFEVDGIRSGNITAGHRFHAPYPFPVRRFDDYVAKLEKAKVILDAERRKQVILTEARNLAFANGLDLVEDEALLEEVSGLVEWPVVLMGSFEEEFLAIPDEVIRLTIKTNQKCFVARSGGSDRLANRFLLVANIEAADGGAEIAHGNGKVVRARLSDAVHFWKTDQADLPDLDSLKASAETFGLDLAKPLDQRMAKLDRLGVTFHAKLGTQGERVARIARLAEEIAPVVGADPALAHRAAILAKADLVTEVVGEFPELQGAMGRKYAELQGEHPSVALAVEQHYRPQGPSDAVPTDPVAVAVALADKLDTLVGFWAIDEKPTGSKDPYALRRAALGVIRGDLENKVGLPLLDFFSTALLGKKLTLSERTYASGVADTIDIVNAVRDIYRKPSDWEQFERVFNPTDGLLSFFHDRLKVYLRDKGARHDLIDAVLAAGNGAPISPTGGEISQAPSLNDDLLLIVRRVEALGRLLDTDTGRNLLAGTKRAANILAAEEKKGTAVAAAVDPALFERGEERALADALDKAERQAAARIAAEDYDGALTALADLRAPIDAFFEAVMVNAEDARVRANRLALLARIRAATGQVADFSKIAG